MKTSQIYTLLAALSIVGAIWLSELLFLGKAIISALFLYACAFTSYTVRLTQQEQNALRHNQEWQTKLDDIKKLSDYAANLEKELKEKDKDNDSK